MSRDYYDLLIEQLLREQLGGDRPRDLSTRVLARARQHDRTRRTWWLSAGTALAASIAIAFSLWLFWPSYPAPVADNLLIYGDGVQEGVKITSNDDSAGSLSLGGYVDMTVGPNTSFTLGGGQRYRERVLLDGGHIDVTTRKQGILEVVIGPATVRMSDSRLGVDVADVIDEVQARVIKRLSVKVLEGSADIRGVDAPATLNKGETRTFDIASEAKPQLMQRRNERQQQKEQATQPANRNRGTARPKIISPAGPDQPAVAQIKLIIGPGPYALYGILRHLGPYQVLQTDHGNYFLGTRDALPQGSPEPGAQSYVWVVFGKGRVTRIERLEALPKSGQTPVIPPSIQSQLQL